MTLSRPAPTVPVPAQRILEHSAVRPSLNLTDAQVQAFRRDGYLSVARVASAQERARVAELFQQLFVERGAHGQYRDLVKAPGAGGHDLLAQVEAPEQQYPELLNTAAVRTGLSMAAAVLDVAVSQLEVWSHMITKAARIGPATPWHQDEAYWPIGLQYESVSMWIPLDDVSIESGCMQFIPGSHRHSVRAHYHIGDDPLVHGLTTDDVAPEQGVACPLRAGGATLHHCRTLHYAGPNITSSPRRAWITVFSVVRV